MSMRRQKKADPFAESRIRFVDYKDDRLLSRFITETGKILPGRLSGATARHQPVIIDRSSFTGPARITSIRWTIRNRVIAAIAPGKRIAISFSKPQWGDLVRHVAARV